MKKLLSLLVVFLFISPAIGQDDPGTAMNKLGPKPIFIIDSQRVKQSELSNYSADSIATVIVLVDTSAIKRYGKAAKDGVVIIETRSFARRQFIAYFRKVSTAYDSLYTSVGNDTSFVYIINDKIQQGNYEGNLSAITDELFEGIEILTKNQLQLKFDIMDKEFGIIVRSKKPENVFDADQKF